MTSESHAKPAAEPTPSSKPVESTRGEAAHKAADGAKKPDGGGPAPYIISDPAEFGKNLTTVMAAGQKLLAEFFARQAEKAGSGDPDPLNIGSAFQALFQAWATDPAKIMQAQFRLWNDYATLWQRTLAKTRGETVEPVVQPEIGDRRFRDKDWQENTVFDFIKQSYLIAANWMQEAVRNTEGLDPKTHMRVDFYTKQFIDALSPSNFVLTNPEVLRETMASNGENLVRGLNNLLDDIERGGGNVKIRQTTDNFVVGKDVATAPGKVVFRNDLMELIQYTPTQEKAYETPLVIFPPWINKFYILDLQPKNSMVRWALERGYTTFVVSWVNPDKKLANKSFENYMREGIFAALDAIEKATGSKQVNAVGYCIAGTLLSATLAYIEASGEYKDRIKSATFFAAQADFSEAGDLRVFIDEHQLDAMEKQMREAGGVLEGSKMATTFNMLRANDLIWSFVVSNYLLGKQPAPFDLLYWNSDTTRMPIAMHMFYLRECYAHNALAKGHMKLGGKKLDLSQVHTPLFFQAAKDDHIAPAVSVYKGARLFGGPTTFMMAGSGHIAGVVNPPSSGKYQHWTNDALPPTLKEWVEGAVEHPGSWWPTWDIWLSSRSGEKIPAPQPGDGELEPLGDAPGTYVMVKAGTMAK